MSIFSAIKNAFSANPTPRIYTGDRAVAVISEWKDEVEVIDRDRRKLTNVLPRMEHRAEEIESNLKQIGLALDSYKKAYKGAKTLDEKRRAARRVLYAVETNKYLLESQGTMNVNLERSRQSLEDAEAIMRLTNQKIVDAELYFDMNQKIVTVGKMMTLNSKVNKRSEEIKTSFDSTLTDFDSYISKLDADDLITQVESIINEK